MGIAARLDDFGKPAWITLMILGFVLFWPVGLAILAFLIGSGRMGCWKHRGVGRWHNHRMDRMQDAMERWCGGRGRSETSGNRAFDDYRAETLRRLEEEQTEFKDFLERLRFAKDRSEFDQFMADRRDRPQGASPQPQPQT